MTPRQVLGSVVIVALLAPPAMAQPQAATPPGDPVPGRSWASDPLGGGLVTAGTAGLILGGVLYLSARTDVAKADQGGAGGISLEEHADLADAADRKQLWAGIAAGAGAALILGGVVRYVTGDRTARVAVAPMGAGASLGWRF